MNLESVARQTGVRPQQLEVPECPPELEYVLDWFDELSEERPTDMAGRPDRLSSEKLEAWSRLERLTLSAFELRVIRTLDRLFVSGKFDPVEEETE